MGSMKSKKSKTSNTNPVTKAALNLGSLKLRRDNGTNTAVLGGITFIFVAIYLVIYIIFYQ